MTESYHIGIDVSKDWLDVFINPLKQHSRYPNTKSGRSKLINHINHLSKHPSKIEMIVFEASGGYERALRQCLAESQLPHACVQPERVHAYLRAFGERAKTDKLDAKALAAFAASEMVRASPAQDKDRLALQDLVRSLMSIREMTANVECRLEKFSDEDGEGAKTMKEIMAAMTAQDASILNKIKALVYDTPALKKCVDLLETMPGVGFYTACVLAAELPELGTCSKGEIAALSGTAPYTRQSGTRAGKSSIRGGRKYARRALYMACVTAMRHNPILKIVYDRLRKAGKPFKIAIVALMRHMVVTLNSMIKNNTPWTSNLQNLT